MKRFILLIICSAALSVVLTEHNTTLYTILSVLLTIGIGAILFSLLTTFFNKPPAPSFSNTTSNRLPENRVSDTAVLQATIATLDGMREGVLVIDSSMRAISCNKAGQEIFSAITGDIVGKRLSEITRLPPVHAAFT
ncbi:MAG: hypothetical protein ACRD63_10245, partial [Pyrinomonadaceae bacterium]